MKIQGQNIMKRLGADKKKLGIMLSLLGVGFLLWGRLLLMHLPRTALAGPNSSAAGQSQAVAGSGPDGSENGKDSAATADQQHKVVRVDLPASLPRDMFALDPQAYIRIPLPVQPSYSPAPTKLEDESADESARVTAVRQEASTLQLRSTMLGPVPRATIGNQTLTEGQTINGFKITKILPRQVIVEKDGVKVLIDM